MHPTTTPAPAWGAYRTFLGVFVLGSVAVSLLAQDAVYPPKKPIPAKIEPHLVVVGESVVENQWTHTLKLVNAPQIVTLLNPGQCIRVGIVSTGDNRDSYLERTKLSFRVKFAGQDQNHPIAPLAEIKQIKPEGGDFVAQIAEAASIKIATLTMASLGVSAERWCAPDDPQDGTATVDGEIEIPGGQHKKGTAKIQIESFETGSNHTFKDAQEFGGFLMHYYQQPNPARLLPALEFFAADSKARSNRGTPESTAAFIAAVLKAYPLAAKDFRARVATQTGFTRVFGLICLRFAGYDIKAELDKLSAETRKKLEGLPVLPDPFDFTSAQDLPTRLDMLWGTFGATGQYEPVSKITSALAWRSDYEEFDKLRKTPNHSTEWTPAIAHAVTYAAAGWALGSFQRNDPLVADYIEYMLASPDVSPNVKSELTGLSSNAAFHPALKK